MSFAANRLALVQEHFIVVEIDLPEITGTCTLPATGGTGYGTPLTCTESWNETDFKTYFFATDNLPLEYGRPRTVAPAEELFASDGLLLDSASSILETTESLSADVIDMPDDVHLVVMSISETPSEIKPGQGLAARLTLNVKLKDMDKDPGPQGTPTDDGTFFGKLQSRNILTNKTARLKYFHVQSDGIYAEADAQTRTYNIEALLNNGDGTYTLVAVDELKKLDRDKAQFPVPTNGAVRLAIDASTTTFSVDSVTDWEQKSRPYIIRIGSELSKVTAVSNNQTASASLTVAARGASIFFTNFITATTAETHDVGDEVQICHTFDAANIGYAFAQILVSADIPGGTWGTDEGTETLVLGDTVEVETGHAAGGTVGNAYRSLTVEGSTDLTAEDYSVGANWEDLGVALWAIVDWKAEVDEWLSGVTIDDVVHDPTTSNAVLKSILNDFLIDMWYDPIDRQVKIAAISVWKASSITLTEGKEINRDTIKINPLESHRNTRAFIHYNKLDKIQDNTIKHYNEVSVNINTSLESAGRFVKPKTKQFLNSSMLDTTRADLLVQRWVSRFGDMPLLYIWKTEERFLNFEQGDVVDIISQEIQHFDGTDKTVRAQVLSIRPRWVGHTRSYDVKAMTYEPAFSDGSEFTITGPSNEINLYVQAGAPSSAVTVTFLLDGGTFGSTSALFASIVAGAFPSGSHIDLVLQSSADLQGAAGDGGFGQSTEYSIPPPTWTPTGTSGSGSAGGIVYDAQGVDTDIYLSGTFSGNVADGTLRAPGGGGGGEDAVSDVAGDGGGGGAGSNAGAGGSAGQANNDSPPPTGTDGTPGSAGDTSGNGGAAGGAGAGAGGGWGEAGVTGDSAGGTAGKGVEDGGATINIKVSVYYLSSSGNQTIALDDSVEVAGGHGAGGVVGDVYVALAAHGLTDLSTEDYTNGVKWGHQFANGSGDTPNSIAAA